MKFINAVGLDARDQLAFDEAMLMSAEEANQGEALRVWEFESPTVIAGRSTRLELEIDLAFCERAGVDVLRRCSGGASVVGGPGCLMYSIVLSTIQNPALRKIDYAHQYVMSRVLNALQEHVPNVELCGICDLAWNERKCSGNSLRVHRDHLLYHGTILYNYDLRFLHRCLKFAPRQPEYRQGRDHFDFVTNVPVDPLGFVKSLRIQFDASESVDSTNYQSRMRQIRCDRYDCDSWHKRH